MTTETMTITFSDDALGDGDAVATVLNALQGFTFEFQSTVIGPIIGRIVEVGRAVGNQDQELRILTGTEDVDVWLPIAEITGAEYL